MEVLHYFLQFCAGCPVDIDVSDASVQQCLKRTLSNLNAASHTKQNLSLAKINKVTSQVLQHLIN